MVVVVVVVVVGVELLASKVRVNVTIDDNTRSTYTFGHPETQWFLVVLSVAFISLTILTRFPNIISDKSIKYNSNNSGLVCSIVLFDPRRSGRARRAEAVVVIEEDGLH